MNCFPLELHVSGVHFKVLQHMFTLFVIQMPLRAAFSNVTMVFFYNQADF